MQLRIIPQSSREFPRILADRGQRLATDCRSKVGYAASSSHAPLRVTDNGPAKKACLDTSSVRVPHVPFANGKQEPLYSSITMQ